jgi:hypothetical protein
MSLNLKLEGFDENEMPSGQTYSDLHVLHILNDFLQPNSTNSLQETVQSILALLPVNAPLSNEVWSAGTVIIEIAAQIPYSHPLQLKLANLVEQLSNADRFIDKPDEKVRKETFLECPQKIIMPSN